MLFHRIADPLIVTRKLIIRKLRPSDRELINRHLNNAQVLRFLGGQSMSRREADDFFAWLRVQQQRHGFTLWPVERKCDGEFMGLCGIVVIDEPDSGVFGNTEIGWRFRADIARNGAAEEAARACLNFAFRTVRTARVVSRTVQANVASWSLMERIGMRHDKRLDYVSVDLDRFIVYVRTASEGPVPPTR